MISSVGLGGSDSETSGVRFAAVTRSGRAETGISPSAESTAARSRLRGQARRLLVAPSGEAGEEMTGQDRHVLQPVLERGEVKRDDVEPVVEIAPEGTPTNLLL